MGYRRENGNRESEGKWNQAVLPFIENRLVESQRIVAGFIHMCLKPMFLMSKI